MCICIAGASQRPKHRHQSLIVFATSSRERSPSVTSYLSTFRKTRGRCPLHNTHTSTMSSKVFHANVRRAGGVCREVILEAKNPINQLVEAVALRATSCSTMESHEDHRAVSLHMITVKLHLRIPGLHEDTLPASSLCSFLGLAKMFAVNDAVLLQLDSLRPSCNLGRGLTKAGGWQENPTILTHAVQVRERQPLLHTIFVLQP